MAVLDSRQPHRVSACTCILCKTEIRRRSGGGLWKKVGMGATVGGGGVGGGAERTGAGCRGRGL